MDVKLQYKVNLPQTIPEILSSDIWVFNHIPAAVASYSSEPMKFSASAFILLRRGRAIVDINLRTYQLKAPAFIKISVNSYLHIKRVSPDLEAGAIVASQDFSDELSVFFRNRRLRKNIYDSSVISLSPEYADLFTQFYQEMERLYSDTNNPDRKSAMLFYVASFFFANGYKLMDDFFDAPTISTGENISERFLSLARKHFATEHQLAFYATNLNVSTKHLSRSVKETTGYSASQWIERFILLEAKVMLKSSGLNVAQISNALHFTTPSAFGKFFRKHTGISPLQFRKTGTDADADLVRQM